MTSPRCITITTLLILGFAGRGDCGPLPTSSDTTSSESSSIETNSIETSSIETNGAATISDARAGLDGTYKIGHWMPVQVTIDGGADGFSGRIELATADGDNLAVRFASDAKQTLTVAPDQQWTGWRYVKPGRMGGRIRVVLRDAAGTVVAEHQVQDAVPHPSTFQWIVSVGTDVGVAEAAAYLARLQDEKVVSTVLAETTQFPDRWFGYEGVNVILLPTGTESLLEKLNDRQFDAFLHWLRQGGRLLMTAGHRADSLFQPGHRFHAFRPGTFKDLDVYWKASGLENFARAAERVQTDERSPLAVFSDLRGRALCLEGAGGTDDRALITQFSVGFGEITFVALDLDLPPISDWPARPRLLARLLQTRTDEEDSAMAGDRMGRVTHVGFDDLAGQLRGTLDQFPDVTLVQFSWVAGLLAAYILIMGPIDFFVLRRLGRPQWTWITFPVTVVLFCGIAVWLAQHWKGSQLQTNQVDIVDIDLQGQLVRGTTWANIYSPESVAMELSIEPHRAWQADDDVPEDWETLASWQGLPGTGLGGMNAVATVDIMSDAAGYQVYYPLAPASGATSPNIERLPIATASSKGIMARWTTAAKLESDSQLTSNSNGLLTGSVSNPLTVQLTQCRVYYQNWAYLLERPLAAGRSARLDSTQPLDLRWRLAGRSVIGTEEVRSAWRRDNLADTDRILEMMMFHDAAGGQAYTGLSHNYQAFVDLTDHLRNGCAILVGRCEQPASHLRMQETGTDGASQAIESDAAQHWTYYRIVIPVQQESRSN